MRSMPLLDCVGRLRGLPVAGIAADHVYTRFSVYMPCGVAKHLVDIDEDALDGAKREPVPRPLPPKHPSVTRRRLLVCDEFVP